VPECRDDVNGEVRRILTPAHDIQVPGIRHLVLFDDSIKTGKTIIGALAWALENKEVLGFEKAYLVASYDLCGVAHFALDVRCDRCVGPVEVMRKGIPENAIEPFPKTYQMLEKKGRLGSIAELKVVSPAVPIEALKAQASVDDALKILRSVRGE